MRSQTELGLALGYVPSDTLPCKGEHGVKARVPDDALP